MATKRDRKTAFPFIKPKGSIKKDVQQYRWVKSRHLALQNTPAATTIHGKSRTLADGVECYFHAAENESAGVG